MSRALTISALLLTALVAFGLYRLSYAVTRLQDELAEYNHGIYADREAIQVLSAEWSYLTRPEALAELANHNLELHPLLPGQITSLAKLPDRLPSTDSEPDAAPDRGPAEVPLPKAKQALPATAPKAVPQPAGIVPVLAGTGVAP
jgi:hypothetical protein